MKDLFVLVCALFVPSLAMAADEPLTVANYSWEALRDADKLSAGTIVPDDGLGTVLKIEAEADQPVTTVLEIENPPITSRVYGIEGRVKYEGVTELGFLELWNHFPDGGAYFSRTLGVSGPLQSLSGRSDWRAFSLPFSFEGATNKQPPSRLQFNVVLPKGGTVWLSDITLKQFPSLAAATTPVVATTHVSETTPVGAWWSGRTGGYVGAVMGTSLGLLGAIIGTLAGIGRARRFTITFQVLGIMGGVVCLIAGVVALIVGQPYAVYYPLLLCGLIGTVVLGALLPVVRNGYAQHELRRMQSVDA